MSRARWRKLPGSPPRASRSCRSSSTFTSTSMQRYHERPCDSDTPRSVLAYLLRLGQQRKSAARTKRRSAAAAAVVRWSSRPPVARSDQREVWSSALSSSLPPSSTPRQHGTSAPPELLLSRSYRLHPRPQSQRAVIEALALHSAELQ